MPTLKRPLPRSHAGRAGGVAAVGHPSIFEGFEGFEGFAVTVGRALPWRPAPL
jgi:hypothetical protein